MHEYSLARSLLDQVTKLSAQHGAARVVAVQLRVGEFSGIEPELLRTAFADLSAETEGGSPRVEIDVVPLTARCDRCGSEEAVRGYRFECPQCGNCSVTITSGEELMLESLRLERVD